MANVTPSKCALDKECLRGIYPVDAFEKENEWTSIWDSSVFKRLQRIKAVGGALSDESEGLLGEIAARHSRWQPSPGDRNDFHVWHESRFGPEGHPELLAKIADDVLVKEAMRLQQERRFEEGDIWRVLCSADPERALRGLRADAAAGQWNAEAWRCLLWTAAEKSDQALQIELADMLLGMPDGPLGELLPSASTWLQRRRENLMADGGLRPQPVAPDNPGASAAARRPW